MPGHGHDDGGEPIGDRRGHELTDEERRAAEQADAAARADTEGSEGD